MNVTSGPHPLLGLFLLLVAAGLQSVLAFHLSILGAQPDLPLTLALTAALLLGPEFGAGAGFAAGCVSAGIVGQTVGTFLVTRTVAGFVAGWLTGKLLRPSLGMVVLGVFLGTLVAEALFGLSFPRIGLSRWLRIAFIGATMNAVLALPVYALLRRLGWER